ncbi:hypothetical protein C8R44DRAFT_760462, partial [Mycena epipterygia]
DDEEVEWERAATAAAITVLGTEEARTLWAQRRKETRLYLFGECTKRRDRLRGKQA